MSWDERTRGVVFAIVGRGEDAIEKAKDFVRLLRALEVKYPWKLSVEVMEQPPDIEPLLKVSPVGSAGMYCALVVYPEQQHTQAVWNIRSDLRVLVSLIEWREGRPVMAIPVANEESALSRAMRLIEELNKEAGPGRVLSGVLQAWIIGQANAIDAEKKKKAVCYCGAPSCQICHA
jgi:hypothetical protein